MRWELPRAESRLLPRDVPFEIRILGISLAPMKEDNCGELSELRVVEALSRFLEVSRFLDDPSALRPMSNEGSRALSCAGPAKPFTSTRHTHSPHPPDLSMASRSSLLPGWSSPNSSFPSDTKSDDSSHGLNAPSVLGAIQSYTPSSTIPSFFM